jgi:alpha-1,6-mannosyltransferase
MRTGSSCDDVAAMPDAATPTAPGTPGTALGLGGSLLIAFGAIGAGGTLVGDTLLAGTPFEALRYGHGSMLALGCVYAGILVLAIAWLQLGQGVREHRVDARRVLRTACVWAAPLTVCPPLFSRDLYSYLAQGALALHGFDPYTTGPSRLPAVFTENVHRTWQDTPTPYGPLHILLTRAVASVSGDNVMAGVLLTRLVFASGLVLLGAALPGLCRILHARTGFALWFAVANPMMLVLLLGGGHNDMLAIGLTAAATLFVLRGRPGAGMALLALALAVKVVLLVVLPFLVWIMARANPQATLSRRTAVAVRQAAVAIVPVFLTLTALAGHGFGWVRALDVSSLIVNWMSAPTGLGELIGRALALDTADEELLISCMRLAGLVTLAVLLTLLWWRARSGMPVFVLRDAMIALALAAVLLPATLPWYYCWAMPFAAVLPWSRRRLAVACAGALWLTVSYYPTGESAVENWDYVGLTLAAAALLGAAAAYSGQVRVQVQA